VSRVDPAPAPAAPGRGEQHRRRLEAVRAALQALDADLAAGRITAADHAARKASHERRAAALRRRLRDSEAGAEPASEGPRPDSARNRRIAVLALVGAALVLALGLALGQMLGRPAPKDATGASGAGGGQAAAVSPRLDALRREVETGNPPLDRLLAYGHLALDEDQLTSAMWAYRRVLEREPGNAEALTHMGMILYRQGEVDQALARIDESLATDPRYAHALWDRAHVLLDGKRDYPAAARAFEAFLEVMPTGEDADRARQMLGEAKRRAAGAPAASRAPVAPGAAAPAPERAEGSKPVMKRLGELKRMMQQSEPVGR